MAGETERILGFKDREVQVAGESRSIVIARPIVAIRLDARRLERMRTGDLVSRVDMDILAAAGSREPPVSVVIFDAASGNPDTSWAFEADLDDEERMAMGFHLLRSQLDLYRELVRLGASGLIGVGFGSRELATFQRATARIVTELSQELESADRERAAQIEVDLWLVEHAATWTGLPAEQYIADKLGAELLARDRNREEIERLLAAADGS